MGSVYSGSYMGFPAPPELDPGEVTSDERRRATILRACGAEASWEWVEGAWVAVFGEDRRRVGDGVRIFTASQALKWWGGGHAKLHATRRA